MQYYSRTDFTWMEASPRGSASEPDKNLTDDWIDGPLISLLLLQLLSKPGTRKHYGSRSAQSVTSVSGSEARQAGRLAGVI